MRLVPALCLLVAAPASAEERWTASTEAALAVPVSNAQRDRFGIGAAPALAVYRSLAPWMLVGARLRAGVLADGAAPPEGIADPGAGGYGSASLALRLRAPQRARRGSGPWLELAAGAAVSGRDVRGAWEAGLGYGFPVGAVDIGPSLRVVRVEDTRGPIDLGSATLGLVGVEVTFFDGGRAPARLAAAPAPRPVAARPPAPPPAPPPEPPVVAVPNDADDDGVIDGADRCPDEPETVNGIDDEDGCTDSGEFVMVDDRIVLEEHVLFDRNRARVKRRGKRVLAAIAALWRQHPEWTHIVVEGHADVRGSDAFNDWLSRERAARVKAALATVGFAPEQVEVTGYGRSRPRDPGRDEAAHQRNRRVEFVVVRSQRGDAPALKASAGQRGAQP